MSEEALKRRLTAILNADVAGFSRLMQDDEEATIRTLTSYRNVMTNHILQYRGRVVDSPGDNLLAEFASVVDAVNCAVEIQRDLAERNAEMSENRKMEFRIGVNLGDVFEEGERIYGNGINIAARMETLADVGGICISGTVYDAIENKIGLEYEFLGEQEVKNIAKPVRAYRVLSFPGAATRRTDKAKTIMARKWPKITLAIAVVFVLCAAAVLIWGFYFRHPSIEPASIDRMAYPLPDKPSLAILPFDNMTGDSNQEYICDGITDQIIISLSMANNLFVIARNSTFTYKGKAVKVQQVAEDLGVRYVLEGSVQKSGGKLRILVQLIDALNGHHIWSEGYDRELKDIFTIQDEIAMKIGTALQVKLTYGEYAASIAATTTNPKALECFWKAMKSHLIFNNENNELAREWAEKAIELDPKFSAAWALLGFTHLWSYQYHWSKAPDHSLQQAVELAKKALAINDSTVKAWMLMGQISKVKENLDDALAYMEKAVDINPNDPVVLANLSDALISVGRHEEAVQVIKKAMRLSPYYPAIFLWFLSYGNFHMERYEEALSAAKELLVRCEKGDITCRIPHVLLAMIYGAIGREEEARAHAVEVLKMQPDYSLMFFSKNCPTKNKSDRERVINAFRKAGLPEKPVMSNLSNS